MTVRIARIDRGDEVAAIAEVVRDWEPQLDLDVVIDTPLIYEPDGTLYAVSLSESELTVCYKRSNLRAGDAIVVPAGVVVEAESPIRLVAIRHGGRPPFHFRERFIQTWGFELKTIRPETLEVIPEADARFRIPYRYQTSVDRPQTAETGIDLHLLIAIEGNGSIETDGKSADFSAGSLALVSSGVSYRVAGAIRYGRMRLTTEWEQEARQVAQYERDPSSWSAEYHGG